MAFDPITAIFGVGEKLIERLFPDPTAKSEAMYKLSKMKQDGELAELAAETELAKGQLEINKTEAAHSNIFVAGWRPAIGWVCAAAFAYHFVVQPFLAFALANAGVSVDLPAFDMDVLNTVLMGMLGLGGLRTVEKVKGVKK